MQDGVGERDVKFTEVEKALSGMSRLEMIMLGIGYDCDKLYQCLSTRYVIVSCGPSVTWCIHMYVSEEVFAW